MHHLEQSVQRDMDLVRTRIAEMASCCQRAVRESVQAFLERNRQRAYAVIIRDQRIDAFEKEIDRLCLEFLVRQQPAGALLRFAYATIKINAELERIGDYAQSIAHQAAKLAELPFTIPAERFVQITDLAVAMLADAIGAFLERDAERARRTIETEDTVDALKTRLRNDLIGWYKDNQLPFEALDPCLTITRRLERVSDQARDICLEALYLCTGEYAKHSGAETFRVLLVDHHDAGAGPMAEAIGEAVGRSKFRFSSVGLDPRPLSEFTLQFMRGKGFDLTRRAPKGFIALPDLDQFHVVVALTPDASKVLPRHAHKRIRLDWHLDDPALCAGSPDQLRQVHEAAFQFLDTHIRALVEAVLDEETMSPTPKPERPT